MDTVAIAGIVLGGCVLFYRAYILPLLAESNLKRKYQSAHEPVLVLQTCELDTEFWAKVKRERERYVQSGNHWALEQNPVIPYPFNQEFSFQWFDKACHVSTVGLGQMEYLQAAMRQYQECLRVWQQRTGKEFGYDATFAAAGQQPASGGLWETGK